MGRIPMEVGNDLVNSKNSQKGCNQAHLFQEFTQEEWEAYPFAGEEN